MITKKHDWRIFGTGFQRNGTINVDIVCLECGKLKTVIVSESIAEKIIGMAANHHPFKIPRSAYIKTIEYNQEEN